ncbi:MAG: flavodoxin [Deltaproteobacteria bacterium]
MSLLKKLNLSGSTQGPATFGISNGDEPGHLGVWGTWSTSESLEVFRVVVKAQSPDRTLEVPTTSYTFAPGKNEPFVHSIETTQEMKQFLVGSDKAKSGQVTFEFWLDNNRVETKVFTLNEVIKNLRGKGSKAPSRAAIAEGYLSKDSAEIAALPHSGLKAHSEKVKSEIAEKLRKAEEERLRLEEEKKAAAAKAQAEAAAKAAKPAAAAAGGAPVDRTKPTLSPAKTAIFFGSSTGNTANVAESLKKELGSVDYLKNITDIHPIDLTIVENIIIGVPTWHIGELQDDWAAMLPEVKALAFAGKKVAVFGLGDGKGYADTYVDGMAELLEPFEKGGAKLCGMWPTDGYEFKKSKAIRDGKFLGLVIDVENQDNLTDKRVKSWASQIQKEMGI